MSKKRNKTMLEHHIINIIPHENNTFKIYNKSWHIAITKYNEIVLKLHEHSTIVIQKISHPCMHGSLKNLKES